MTVYECPRHGAYGRDDSEITQFWQRTQRCARCHEEHEQEVRRAKEKLEDATWMWEAWQRSGVPARYRTRRVRDWVPSQKQMASAKILFGWGADMDDRVAKGIGLLLLGGPGVGKTHLLAGICASAIQAGYEARYASWPEVWSMFRPPCADAREQRFDDLSTVEVLALDEVGVGKPTDKELARLFELIDRRYSRQLPTLVATNLTSRQLESMGERTVDRLREVCIAVSIPGASYRGKAAEAPVASHEPFQRPQRPEVVSLVAVDGQDVQCRWGAR